MYLAATGHKFRLEIPCPEFDGKSHTGYTNDQETIMILDDDIENNEGMLTF
jgi:hypothetical protein